MADQYFWLGSTGPFGYEDATEVAGDPGPAGGYYAGGPPDQSALVTTGQIDVASAPTLDPHVLRLVDVGVIVGNVISDANIVDHAVVRGDGGLKKIQDSNVLINDAGDITVVDDAWIGIGAAAERIVFDAAGDISFLDCKVGINTETSGVMLHIKTTTRYSGLRIANATNTLLNIYPNSAGIEDALLHLYTGGVSTVFLNTNGSSYFNGGSLGIGTTTPGSLLELGFTTENLEFVDAGSVAATQQDWIEVQVGNVQGYIHVFAAK